MSDTSVGGEAVGAVKKQPADPNNFPQNPVESTRLDAAAREAAVSLLGTIRGLSDKVRDGDESNWHFSITAPRWALRSPRQDASVSGIAATAAAVLAGLGVWLAWYATRELATSNSALAVQIGPWVAVAVLLAGAGAVAYTATGSRRLHMRMTQLNSGDIAAGALAASASGRAQQGGAAGDNGQTGENGSAAFHAAAADKQAAAAADAAGGAADAAPAVASAAASAASAHASAASMSVAGAGTGSADSGPDAKDPATTISPKVVAGSIASAISFGFWTIAAATFWKHTFSSDALAALVGSTTTIVGAAAAYLRTDPLRAKHGT